MAENKCKMPPLKRLGEYIHSAPEKIAQTLKHQRTLLRQGETPLLGELLASPELQDDLTRLELEIQRQRANVEAADEARDFRQEVDEGLAKLEQATMEPQ